MRTRRVFRFLAITGAALAALVLAMSAAGVLILRSGWFAEQVRLRIVRELETATGGRAELGGFRFHWREMRAEVRDLIVHGIETQEAPPLIRIDRVELGLKIISALEQRVDLLSLTVTRPRVAVTAGRDGRWNFPSPRVSGRGDGWKRFLDLAVDEYRVIDGELQFRSERWPLDASGRNLQLTLALQPAQRRYAGQFSARSLELRRPLATPMALDAEIDFSFAEDRLEVSRAELLSGGSRLTTRLTVHPFQPTEVRGNGNGTIRISDLARAVSIPLLPTGQASLAGEFRWSAAYGWRAEGRLSASRLAWRRDVEIRNIAAKGAWRLAGSAVELTSLRVAALDGSFQGAARVARDGAIRAAGAISGMDLRRLVALGTNRPFPWGSRVSGQIEIEGPRVRAEGQLKLERTGSGPPLDGEVAFRYEQDRGVLELKPSHLELGSSRLDFAGDPEHKLEFAIRSANLEDLRPALEAASAGDVERLPAELAGGELKASGSWKGGFANPQFAGHAEVTALRMAGQQITEARTDFEISAQRLAFRRALARLPVAEVAGQGAVELRNWRFEDAAPVTAEVTVRGESLGKLARNYQFGWPVEGVFSGAFHVEGTWGAPRAIGKVRVERLVAWGEDLERLDAEVRYSATALEVANGRVRDGSIEFEIESNRNNEIRFRTSTRASRLRDWRFLGEQREQLDTELSWKLSGSARRLGTATELLSLDGELRSSRIRVRNQPVGQAVFTARTQGRTLAVAVEAAVRDSTVQGRAEWSLTGNSFGLGQIRISRLSLATLQDLGLLTEAGAELAVDGRFDAEIGFSGPVLRPEVWTGLAKVTSLEISPRRPREGKPGNGTTLVLRNRDPLVAYVDVEGVRLQAVHLVAGTTDLEVTGMVAFRRRSPWNLQVRGRLNLPSLSAFEPDLVADGVSTLDASIRGSFERPQIFGKMEIQNASFRIRGLPNGLERATGTIVFDRTRANIERFTAVTGGGELSVTGFVGFGGPDLLYRLQGSAQRVRVRYPESVSTTFNAEVSLTGTIRQSLLAGSITVNRVGLNPQTDIGSLLSEAGKAPVAPAAPNEFLRGMQLDLRVAAAPDAELQTSLARNIQPEANLRVRGSAAKPVLLGRIGVNQGEINFFGNQYAITRGEVSFFNTAKIEPVLDLDLETKVRGITVNINFSGPMGRLTVSYRSDPPLQSSEIVALLTVGRTPGSGITPNLPAAPGSPTMAQAGNNTILGQAISAPISGRLERLFGVSRIKIDPDLTGVTNTPQARLTVEQQLSRDITVTYITNLNRTQQQIVRLEWNFSREFSVLAVRDENGVFGVDLFWRRRF